MFPFKYKDGTEPKQFDVVTFNVEDSDDFSNWALICILTKTDFIYLSGGPDCGLNAGKRISFEEAIELSDDNEAHAVGFKKVGTHYQIPGIIAKGFGV